MNSGESEGLGILRERECGGALRGASFHLDSCSNRVPEGDDDERYETTRCGTAPFIDHPVVIGLNAERGEVLVFGLVEKLATEPGERGEVQRREDTRLVHVSDALDWVVCAGSHLIE
ncbi:unannotated protein [freshwater metagenome]|uniref:Unannotated protein n=1 Tax=freshwater metagenome TaxID=449393 RepID=A0A6J6ANV0_9ZZZZ